MNNQNWNDIAKVFGFAYLLTRLEKDRSDCFQI